MSSFVALDVETANGFMGSICQIGAVRFINGVESAALDLLVNPNTEFSERHTSIHGIDAGCVIDAPVFSEYFQQLLEFVGDLPVVTHTQFDRTALRQACAAANIEELPWNWLDSSKVARLTWSEVSQSGYGLANLATRCGIEFTHHNACQDARAAGLIMLAAITESGISVDDWVNPTFAGSRNTSARLKLDANCDGPLSGEVMCFTGQLSLTRQEAARRANMLGAAIQPSVTKKTTILVVGDQDLTILAGHQKSSKHRQAESLAEKGQLLRIIAECDFMAL